ncbi:MAG: hypothetical protein MRJ92_00530 [Nitrospira sp.]|nr:hypothetical protein [Nitrospira sp.]
MRSQAVNDAIVELTDAPGLGKRTTVDLAKRWGSDRSVIDSATAKLQDGSVSQSGGAGADAMRQLNMAVNYGKAVCTRKLACPRRVRCAICSMNRVISSCDTVPKSRLHGTIIEP